MALTTARIFVVRGCPPDLAGGINGGSDAPFSIRQITGIGFAIHRALSGLGWGLFCLRRGTGERLGLLQYTAFHTRSQSLFAPPRRTKPQGVLLGACAPSVQTPALVGRWSQPSRLS